MNKIAKIVLISVGIGGASLLGGISLVNIGINIENEPAQPISPEELAEQSDIENKKDGLRAMKEGDFFRLWSIFMLFQTWSYVKKKYKLNMPFLRLASLPLMRGRACHTIRPYDTGNRRSWIPSGF